MSSADRNPFLLAKSNDLTDEQIQRYWVDFAPPGSGQSFFTPTSPMPTIILGGKGSGKTHLMRYYSFGIQQLRFDEFEDWTEALKADKYLGIYTRASGLSAGKFQGKGIDDEQWAEAFMYYVELWLAQELLAVCDLLLPNIVEFREKEDRIAVRLGGQLSNNKREDITKLRQLSAILRNAQKQLDIAINEAAFTHKLKFEFFAARGNLIFGFPRILRTELECMKKVLFCYCIDELENFNVWQQMFINTLVRERELPTTFRVGARTYGMRTYLTNSAQEEIKEGSEFEHLKLDAKFRASSRAYKSFCQQMVLRRVEEVVGTLGTEKALESSFELPNHEWQSDELLSLTGAVESGRRPYMRRLEKQLALVLPAQQRRGIIKKLSEPGYPLLEKTAIYLFYQAWAKKESLYESAENIKILKTKFLTDKKSGAFGEKLDHFKNDFVAQLYRDCDRPQVYAGLDNFIEMSEGLPRALLTLLKHVYSWASFKGERPFEGGRISVDSQRRGVRDAAEWFINDIRQGGEEGIEVRAAIGRLAEIFRINRFADKPAECSLIAFSVDTTALNQAARAIIHEAEKRSFLISVAGGQRDRNTKKVTMKYQLSKMLCPYFDLPIARRGVARFDVGLAEAIFDNTKEDEFTNQRQDWDARLNAPFERTRKRKSVTPDQEPDLFR